MIEVEIDETIERPIEDVFDRLVDIASYPDWMPDDGLFLDCSIESEGPVSEGTLYKDVTKLGTVEGEVAEYQNPTRVLFHYTACLMGMTAIEGWPGYTLRRQGENATRVHHRASAMLSGPLKLLQPLFQRIAVNERQRTVSALKHSLETGVTG